MAKALTAPAMKPRRVDAQCVRRSSDDICFMALRRVQPIFTHRARG
jgi:hypothetical protein